MRVLVDRPGLRPWLGVVTTLGGVVGLTFVGPFADPGWESPLALFWLVVVAAGLCALGAAA